MSGEVKGLNSVPLDFASFVNDSSLQKSKPTIDDYMTYDEARSTLVDIKPVRQNQMDSNIAKGFYYSTSLGLDKDEDSTDKIGDLMCNFNNNCKFCF